MACIQTGLPVPSYFITFLVCNAVQSAAVSLALSMMGLWEPMGKNEVLTNVVSFFVSLSSWITCWIILRLCVIDRVHFLFVEHLRPGAYGSYFNKGNAEERDSLVVTRV